MTQVATPESFTAPVTDRISLDSAGRRYDIWRDGDEFWVELDDPDADGPSRPRVTRQLVMLTGSHGEQRLWVASGRGARLDMRLRDQ